MNPFNNRWLALFVVVGFMLVVAELVGTGEHGGVLSQATRSYAASDGAGGDEAAEAPHPEVVAEPPRVIEDVPEDVPDEDMPQLVTQDDVEDDSDLSAVDDVPEQDMAGDASDDGSDGNDSSSDDS